MLLRSVTNLRINQNGKGAVLRVKIVTELTARVRETTGDANHGWDATVIVKSCTSGEHFSIPLHIVKLAPKDKKLMRTNLACNKHLWTACVTLFSPKCDGDVVFVSADSGKIKSKACHPGTSPTPF